MNTLKTFLAAGVVTLLAGAANAATSKCIDGIPDVTDYVTNTSGCEISDTVNNDSPLADFLNESWFGTTDWSFLAKDDSPVDGTIDDGSGLSISKADPSDDLTLTGLWSIVGYNPELDYMLVFKDGTKADPAALVSYLVLAGSGGNGEYESMFFNDPSGLENPKEISHISLYSRPSVIPLPAAGWLLLGGLGGLAAMKRRRKS